MQLPFLNGQIVSIIIVLTNQLQLLRIDKEKSLLAIVILLAAKEKALAGRDILLRKSLAIIEIIKDGTEILKLKKVISLKLQSMRQTKIPKSWITGGQGSSDSEEDDERDLNRRKSKATLYWTRVKSLDQILN